MAPGPRTRKGARKTTQTPTTFRLKKFASQSAPIRRSSRLIFRRSLPMLPAGSPQTISDSTSPLPISDPSPAASLSSPATPPSSPPSPHSPPSHNEVIPLAWFNSDSARAKFLSRFLTRSVHACEIVNVDSFRAENLGFIEYLLQSHCGQLLDLTAEFYPQLVRIFYANIRPLKTGDVITLECQVKYTKFTLTESELNTIFDLPSVTQPHLSPLDIQNKFLSEFAKPHSPTDTAHLSSAILKRNPRLLHYILVRTILPKPNSTPRLTRSTLELLYLLLTSKPINFARYILRCMSKVSSILHPAPLPYANLLTRIFRHFGVSLTNEVFATKPVPIITPAAFKTIQFFKTAHNGWKFVEDMTAEELLSVPNGSGSHVPPPVPSAHSPPPSSHLDQIQHLNERLYELQETPDTLEYILVQHTDALDDIAHNQAIMDNRLNRI